MMAIGRLVGQHDVAHYHVERPHQSLDNELVVARAVMHGRAGKVSRRQRLGGMLNHYEFAAA